MTAWARVSVAGPSSSIDVGLPSDLPITDFLDELVLRLAGPPEVADAAREWALCPVGRDALAPHESLRDAGIGDGTWLVLREGPAEDPAVLIDDTLDALTELTDARHRSWSPRAATVAGSVTAVAATLVGAVGLIVARATGSGSTQVTAASIALLGSVALLAGALYAGRRATGTDPLPTAICAMAATMSAAAGFAVVPGPPGAGHALLGAVAATACAIITLRFARCAPVAHLAAITAGFLGAGTAAISLAGLDRPRTAILIAVVALLLILTAPRLTVVLAKIPLPPVPSPGEPVDAVEAPLLPTVEAVDALSLRALPDIAALTRRAEHARQYLTGLCLGAAAAAAAAIATAGVDPPDWRFTTVALGVGVALVLRGRSHTDLMQAAGLIGGGVAGILGFLAALLVSGSPAPARSLTTAVVALGVAALALLIGGWSAGRTFSPIQRRAAELAEYGLLVVVIPLLLWALDVYRVIREAW